MAAAAAGGGPGRDISLAALRRHDPYISRIVDVASQVALYAFGPRASEWEKTDVEGTLFVYTRSASPKHGFTIMNRLSMENRTEPITKDLDFQLQDPFLLYRNARLSIYGIWFYDKEECQRIAELMKNLTQCEQLKAHQSAGAGIPPGALGSREGKEVDILRMLTKARDEYTKCKTCSEPKQITSSSAIYDNPNLIKPIPVKPSENPQHRGPQASQTFDPEPQHLSLTALFGRQDKAACQEIMGRPATLHHHQQQQQQEQPVEKQGVVGALPSEEPGRPSPRLEKPLCPAIQKLLVRSADQPPLSELPGDPLCRSGHRPPAVDGVPGAPRTQHLMEKPQSSPGSPAGLCRPPQSASRPVCLGGALPPPASEQQQGRGTEPAGPTLLAGAQGGSSGLAPLLASARPALAPKFPAAARSSTAGKPSESWIHSEKQPPPSQVISSQRVPAAATPPLLVSPMVFTQGPTGLLRERSRGLLAPGTPDRRAAPASLLVSLQKPEPTLAPGGALSKRQLQEALLHLIQNDDNFLNIIYEAYLFSMTQAAVRKTL